MKLLRAFPALAFTLVFLSIVALALAQRSIPLLLVAGALTAISWYITEGPRGLTLPKWVSHVLVIAVALYCTAELMQQGLDDVQGVLGRFGLWLTLIKLYERRTARDHGHLLMLSFLLMLVASLQATGLLFSVILIAYMLLGLYVLLLYQLYASHERVRRERHAALPAAAAESEPAPLPSLKPIIGQNASMNFRGLVMVVGIVGFFMGALVFVAFPRGLLEDRVPLLASSGNRAQAGFTDSINLMHGGRITDSRRSIMTVQVLDADGEPYQYYEPLRLRGSVLTHYDGNGGWRPTRLSPQRFAVGPDEFKSLGSYELDSARTLTQVVRSRIPPSTIFSLSQPVAASADRAVDFAYDAATQLLFMPDKKDPPPLTYRVKFQPIATDEVVSQLVEDRPVRWRQGLNLLRNADVAELAQSILDDAGYTFEQPDIQEDPSSYARWVRDVAQLLTRYLHSPEFHYTLDLDFVIPSHEDAAVDPIHYFLFEAKRGHCEYFASALVALCENLNIESRLISGYIATEYNDLARRYDVLARNAHAWVEVRTGENRWVVFDPTPPAALRELMSEPATLAERIQSIYDRFDVMWSHNVLAFDARSQERLAERWDLQLTERITGAFEVVREWFLVVNVAFALGPAGSIYLGFVLLILLFAIVVLVKLLRRSAAIRRAAHLEHVSHRGLAAFWEIEYQRMLRDSGFYLDMLEALERQGLMKPRWMPPLAYAEALAAEHPAIGAMLSETAELFYRSRYGRKPLTPDEVAAARERLAQLTTAAKSTA